MSAGEEYVVRVDKPTSIHLSGGFSSEHDASEFAIGYTMGTDWTYTVHKLGPAIDPPEPREWVVLRTDGTAHNTKLYTRQEAKRMTMGFSPESVRIYRVIPEDPS